jgi:hypothetical protein
MNRNSLLVTAIAAACALVSPVTSTAADDGGWVNLFNGKDLSGWTDQNGGPPKGWDVQDGAIHRAEKGGNLHTSEVFYDFELEFEWKVAKGVNSGLKYRFHDGVGPEYQILDDANATSETKPLGQAAALYVIKEATGKKLNPAGEWNQSKIVAKGNRIEHWLNGVKVVEIEIDTDEWKKRKAASKFKDREKFGQHPGPIHLQDHGGEAWFRNLRIRKLD